MSKMSKEAEQEIVTALESAVKATADGSTPDDAIFKAANDAKLGPQAVQRMVEAFNISKTLSHLKSASSDGGRADSFPIANSEQVLARMFPAEPDTPQKQASLELHPDYILDAPLTLQKQAIALPPLTEKRAEAYPRLPGAAAGEIMAERDKLQRLHKEAKNAFQEVYFRLWKELDKAASYWRQVGVTVPFDEVEKRAYATYGLPATTFMDMVYDAGDLGHRQLQVKRASAMPTQQMYFDADAEPYNYVADAMLLGGEVMRLRKEAALIEHTIHEHALTKGANLLPPQDVKAAEAYFASKLAG